MVDFIVTDITGTWRRFWQNKGLEAGPCRNTNKKVNTKALSKTLRNTKQIKSLLKLVTNIEKTRADFINKIPVAITINYLRRGLWSGVILRENLRVTPVAADRGVSPV